MTMTFGHTDNPFEQTEFAIEFADLTTREVLTETFRSWTDPGSGPVLDFMRSGGSDAAALQMAGRLVFAALTDDDGLPTDAEKPVRGDDEDDESWADRQAAWDTRDRWSSRRRFSTLVYDPRYKLAGTVVVDLAEWIAKSSMQRPTKRA